VDGGARLSDAFGRYPDVFSHFYVSMVRSGETAGKLDEVLNYLADQQEKDFDLMNKTRGAMIYPAFILSGLIVVGIVMMVFVVPKLTGILQETGGELPITTRLLIGISGFMTTYWWLGVMLFIGGVIGLYYYRKSEAGHKQIDFIILKMPIFGPIIFQKLFLVRFTRSLSTLLSGGVSLPEALKITSEVVGNDVYKEVIVQTIKEVEDGNSIATVFLTSSVVPNMVAQMLAVGEQTGRIDTVLVRLSDFYTREVDNAVANLVTLIEPLILMLMGVAVGVMVAAILLPLYNLATSM
ncbi:MAG: type II secretion system F family protein, partial [Candidatus Komeilibacteria bacterium]|nr:type II secretion system F family protein [Candidatus Komeilibacteria bacterium]